ncbi:helix-turn-helix domain-containing protein [Priestia sp. LL-8]|uniref:helix-turn-helix domain-containing protein n=1 Tax=Priestia sp. LL-8 TaxID=3110068 RepID=UPI002E2643C7|nr:helix-turn-helix transcriptional regulator [Priestia sp. LL-8]
MEEKNIKLKFGLTIKNYRLLKGISQEKLAEKVGLHRTYISEVERGERNISLVNIQKIAEGLDVAVSDIFLEVEKGSDH